MHNSIYLLGAIFNKPIFQVSDLVKKLNREHGVHEKTASGLLKCLKDVGILCELKPASGRRAAVLYFPRLINRAEGRETA